VSNTQAISTRTTIYAINPATMCPSRKFLTASDLYYRLALLNFHGEGFYKTVEAVAGPHNILNSLMVIIGNVHAVAPSGSSENNVSNSLNMTPLSIAPSS
jgi:hypothetical protein